MGIISIILGILGSIPQMISIVMSIIKLIQGLHPSARGAALLALQSAYKSATQGNTSNLQKLHEQLMTTAVAPGIHLFSHRIS
jgi:hypothetical protein